MSVPLVAAFVLVGAIALAATMYQWGVVDVIISVIVTGPIVGAALVIAPSAILARHVSSWILIAAAEVLIAGVILAAVIAVSTDEHSTAGIGLLFIPVVGSAIAGATAVLSRSIGKGRLGSASQS
ncbi:MAG: hypothetical protein ACRENI_14945 [Gemmatimonadaceae bacterium]